MTTKPALQRELEGICHKKKDNKKPQGQISNIRAGRSTREKYQYDKTNIFQKQLNINRLNSHPPPIKQKTQTNRLY